MQACLKKLFQGKLFPLYPLLPFSRRKNSNRAVKDVFFGVKPHSFFSGRRATLKKKNLGPLLRFFSCFSQACFKFFFLKDIFFWLFGFTSPFSRAVKGCCFGPLKSILSKVFVIPQVFLLLEDLQKASKTRILWESGTPLADLIVMFYHPGPPKKMVATPG